jgi:hypothetical protein
VPKEGRFQKDEYACCCRYVSGGILLSDTSTVLWLSRCISHDTTFAAYRYLHVHITV